MALNRTEQGQLLHDVLMVLDQWKTDHRYQDELFNRVTKSGQEFGPMAYRGLPVDDLADKIERHPDRKYKASLSRVGLGKLISSCITGRRSSPWRYVAVIEVLDPDGNWLPTWREARRNHGYFRD